MDILDEDLNNKLNLLPKNGLFSFEINKQRLRKWQENGMNSISGSCGELRISMSYGKIWDCYSIEIKTSSGAELISLDFYPKFPPFDNDENYKMQIQLNYVHKPRHLRFKVVEGAAVFIYIFGGFHAAIVSQIDTFADVCLLTGLYASFEGGIKCYFNQDFQDSPMTLVKFERDDFGFCVQFKIGQGGGADAYFHGTYRVFLKNIILRKPGLMFTRSGIKLEEKFISGQETDDFFEWGHEQEMVEVFKLIRHLFYFEMKMNLGCEATCLTQTVFEMVFGQEFIPYFRRRYTNFQPKCLPYIQKKGGWDLINCNKRERNKGKICQI